MTTDLCFAVSKFSHALGVRADNSIPWTHISAVDLFVIIKGGNGGLNMKIVHGTTVLESVDIGTHIDDAMHTRRSAQRDGISLQIEQLQIFGISKEALLALRYRVSNGQARRLQLRLPGSAECDQIVHAFASRGMEFQQQYPRQVRPTTAATASSVLSLQKPLTAPADSVLQRERQQRPDANPFRLPTIEPGSLSQRSTTGIEANFGETLFSQSDSSQGHAVHHARHQAISRPMSSSQRKGEEGVPPFSSQQRLLDLPRTTTSAGSLTRPEVRSSRQPEPSTSTLASSDHFIECPTTALSSTSLPGSACSASRPDTGSATLHRQQHVNSTILSGDPSTLANGSSYMPSESPSRYSSVPLLKRHFDEPPGSGTGDNLAAESHSRPTKLSRIEDNFAPRPDRLDEVLRRYKRSPLSGCPADAPDDKVGSLNGALHELECPSVPAQDCDRSSRTEPVTAGVDSVARAYAAISNSAADSSDATLTAYASQSAEDRQAALDQFMLRNLNNPAFTLLCRDVENCWRRITLGL